METADTSPKTQARGVILRFHEIAIKGDNRGWFEERLIINARKLLQRELRAAGAPARDISISRKHGRILIHTDWDERVKQALERVFGVTGFSPVRIVPTTKEQLLEAALEEFRAVVAAQGLPASFRVLTRRSDKALPEKSAEIDYYVGGTIKDLYPSLKVDLKHPAMTLGIEIRNENSFVWMEKHAGPGGMPVGTNGPALCLLSGGLDSPVAALRILRRGAPVHFLHFYGTPFVGEEALQKIEDLARLINRYQPDPLPLHVVPFGKIQEKIARVTQPKLRTLLYRRMMIRISCEVARQLGIQALVTGEALGQVASQTMENIATIDSVSTLPILRPLVGHDKDEIIQAAKRWGTYETSIRPAADCCTLFADRHPLLRSTEKDMTEAESAFSVPELVQEALAQIETKRV